MYLPRTVFPDTSAQDAVETGPEEISLGTCPVCKQDKVLQNTKAWGCSRWCEQDGGCSFPIWCSMCGRIITEDEALTLIQEGWTLCRTGRSFWAILCPQPDGSVRFEFPSRS